ncbi:zinc ribbon domain-containing protein [Parachlamydia sp. AcF125]|uniref:FmdB family zinc ribbon protein n=1 Tax=Parachlamydia sp. AcF125 TaxID=2795736 RepID=UPI001BCA1DF4|nr:zinc ribbon domain-containing protein [Parachlamydia sp. AcF125]MBS4167904.1 hypothetical protein [Parachlamydia sp. AcF125]
MPTYDYTCQKCGHQLEVNQKITAEPLTTCPACSNDSLRRGPGGGSSLLIRGKDFYYTDYGPGKQAASKQEGSCCPCGKNASQCDS